MASWSNGEREGRWLILFSLDGERLPDETFVLVGTPSVHRLADRRLAFGVTATSAGYASAPRIVVFSWRGLPDIGTIPELTSLLLPIVRGTRASSIYITCIVAVRPRYQSQ